MLLIPSKVFLVDSDPVLPISRRTGPGVPPLLVDEDRSFVAESEEAGHNCFGLAPGSNLELGSSSLVPLIVTALAFGCFRALILLASAIPSLRTSDGC